MKVLNAIDDFVIEINHLRKRSELLDDILKYYNMSTMDFEIPDKWKNINRISEEARKKMPINPRYALFDKIRMLLIEENKMNDY